MTRKREATNIRHSVCFDTTPLIWGVRGYASRDQEHMIEITKRYIQEIEDRGFAIMVPTPVISEYFVGATDTEIREAELIQRGFETPVLDLPSSMLAVELQRGGIVDAIHAEYGTPKQHIRIDAFIIAIALTNKAFRIVTNNVKEFLALAKGRIIIESIPEEMWDDSDSLFDVPSIQPNLPGWQSAGLFDDDSEDG